jgi:tetratricopeptide (TPR) repeat protein
MTDTALQTALEHHNAGRLREAEAIYRQTLALYPEHPQALHLLGLVMHQQSQPLSALELIRRAIAANPQDAYYHCNLGVVLAELGRHDQAVGAYRRAIELRPDFATAHYNLGNSLSKLHQYGPAVASYQKALALQPSDQTPQYNLAIALEFNRQFDEAKEHYRRALALDPQDSAKHVNYSSLLFVTGQWREAWDELEWYHKFFDKRQFAQPQWDCSPARDKKILIYSTGGYGDVIQLIRFIPQLQQRAGQLIVECQDQLIALFAHSFPGIRFIARGSELGEFDLQLRLDSVPRMLGITRENLPAHAGYLSPPPDRLAKWSGRVPADGKLNVGLTWAGTAGTLCTRTLETFAPLAQTPGVRFYNFQKGPESNQSPPPGMQLENFMPDVADFADAAAFASQLDLIVTIDTGVVHLGGAINKPTWVLIHRRSGDFRWPLDRDNTPWYPSVRQFRQKNWDDWSHPVAELAEALNSLAASRRR